jgi:predicted ribosomally synthesized peptide with nif11-like leader
MSQAAANTFLDRLEHDTPLRVAWQTALQQAVQAAMVALAAGHGCHFTIEELGHALAECEHQLSDEDLAAVSGDLNPQPEPPMPRLDFQKLLNFGLTLPRF